MFGTLRSTKNQLYTITRNVEYGTTFMYTTNTNNTLVTLQHYSKNYEHVALNFS
jgi:hypothetical protein